MSELELVSEASLSHQPEFLGAMKAQGRPLLAGVLLLTVLTGAVFPLMLGVVARAIFPTEAGGSLIVRDGKVVGSTLIGQDFNGPGYFHPRPSAAGSGYDAAHSSGTNLDPSSHLLLEGEAKGDFAGVHQLADQYRTRNGMSQNASVPVDAVTRSGSGLDPHISPANARLQAGRVARERGLTEEAVRALVENHTSRRQFGLLGEPRVSVLTLNLALDQWSIH